MNVVGRGESICYAALGLLLAFSGELMKSQAVSFIATPFKIAGTSSVCCG